MRLFTAIELPLEIRKKISAELLEKIPRELKEVEEENLHITLIFMGEKSTGETERIKQGLSKIIFPEFKIRLRGIGSFSKNVLWIGIETGAKELGELAEKTAGATGEKNAKFHAHVTIARNKKMNYNEFRKLKEKLSKPEFMAEFNAQKMLLMESKLTENKPLYVCVSERTFSKRVSGS